ncbi:SusC/RagA family TonB-linked outer membrane protein [Niastella sp. OAS944]|uniref:SusC/RagA family TonB-linked outer membrane protein n=1 Tax=Niastella sp. OAS944 TaxID=2664089 RepID=UPI003475E6F3|nr:iron complex outermembrane receptor protein [Chitinophagaceae bacterium OAS944]
MPSIRLLKAILPLFIAFYCLNVNAQTKQITGNIKDSKGAGIAGASVVIKGSQGGTTTGSDGFFRLNVPEATKTLTVSAVGFTSQDVDVSTSNVVSLVLVESQSSLNEVVVVGYGGVRKRDITGSVAVVSAKDFNKGQINTPEQLLQGKVPGLQITNSSGQPGGLTIVKIRGNNSIRTGNTPLYVVDGVILDGRTPRPNFAPSGVGTTPASDPLTFINPNEISDVQVLKDASASAIFGSRGANGVIQITTKKGALGPAKIDVNASVGFSNEMRKIDVLDAGGYRAAIAKYGAPNSDSGANINPFDEILRHGATQNYSVALSGGNENGRYRASFFAGDQDGIILKSNLKKYVGNFNGQYKFLDKKLSIDFNTTVANVGEHIAPISQDAGSNGTLISLALIWNPTLRLRYDDGTYNQANPSGQVNPLALSDAYTDISNITTVLGNVNAAYKFFDWLEYRFVYGLNYGTGNRKGEIQGWIKGTGGNADGAGAAAVLNNNLFSQTLTHTLNFNKDIGDDFSINALAGYEYWKTEYWGSSTSVFGFDYNLQQTNRVANHYYDNMDDGKRANLNTGSFRDPIVEIQSYFARGVFNYQGKYSLTATFRADGSSKFGSENRYAYFPSLAASWLISGEDFMKGSHLFNTLKLRLGYGQTGNQEFAADAALDVYRYSSNGSITTNHFGNKNLKWETVESYNVGLDFAMLGNRLNGVVDYFYKKTKDPIFLAVVPQPTGAGGVQYKNLDGAYVRNSGVEVGLWGDIIMGKDFNWSANANVTFVKNKFIFPQAGKTPLALTGGLHGQGTTNAFSEAIAHNQPVDVFYLPTFQGFDKDGIGVYTLTPDYVGDPNPSAYVGFSTDVSYKKWSINLGTHGSFGNKLYNNTAMSVLNISNINGGRNIASGLVTTSESSANPITTSTRFLESGNYFKLHSATLRYTFGNVGKYLKNFSIYVAANNVFVISKYKGFDPEVNVDKALNGIPSLGVDYIGYPTQRTFLFGTSFSL